MNDKGKKQGDHDKAGTVRHDSRGNAVWQWAADTGRHAIDSTSRLLKRLEVPGLKMADDPPPEPPKPHHDHHHGLHVAHDEHDKAPKAPDAGGGYDPYGGMGPSASKRTAAAPSHKPAVPVRKPAAAPETRPSLWRRLTGKD